MHLLVSIWLEFAFWKQSYNICLLIWVLSLFTFNVIIGMVGLKFTVLTQAFYLYNFFLFLCSFFFFFDVYFGFNLIFLVFHWGFPGSSVSKESACSAGDPSSISGSWRCPGEGNDKPLQYLCLENPMDRGAWQATVHGIARVGHNLATKPPQCFIYFLSWFLAIPLYYYFSGFSTK